MGTILSNFGNLACLYMHLPETLDMVVLENVGGWAFGQGVRLPLGDPPLAPLRHSSRALSSAREARK